MDSYPIDFPAADAPDTAEHRTARVLGIHPRAVALFTLGWPAAPRVYHRDVSRGEALSFTWFIGGNPTRTDRTIRGASAAVDGLRLTGERALSPAHPLRAAMLALENLAALQEWQARGGLLPYAVPCGAFLALTTAPAEGTVLPCPRAEVAAADLLLAAAAVTVGFVPWPQALSNPANPQQIGIGFPNVCALQPELTFADLVRATQPAEGALSVRTLPGWEAEEHPFFYALAAVRNVAPMLQAQKAAVRRAILERQNPRQLQRRALVSNALLEGTDALSERVKSSVRRHLERTIS